MALVSSGSYVDRSSLSTWADDEYWVKGIYDFDVDTGATASTYNLMNLPVGAIITDAFAHVTTLCTSGGSATVIMGQTSDTDSVIESVAVGDLSENSIHPIAAKRYCATGENNVLMTIGTAALTAGVIELHVKIKKGN